MKKIKVIFMSLMKKEKRKANFSFRLQIYNNNKNNIHQ